MSSALIGHTGFVGGNLLRQRPFDALYHSKNIEEIAGKQFDLLVCSGMPAAKWVANRDPEGDLATLNRLLEPLRRTRAKQVVVVSTVDVYPSPIEVDEDSSIDPALQHPYGRHRYELELQLRAQFPNVLVVRLPGLFGTGLRKNAIYDLLHNNELHKIQAAGVFQFYNLDRIWSDIQRAQDEGLETVNFATEPTSVRELARVAFGIAFENDFGTPARYDMRSKHAAHFGGKDGYLYSRDQVLNELRAFVVREKAGDQ